jgi:hypothetical protein
MTVDEVHRRFEIERRTHRGDRAQALHGNCREAQRHVSTHRKAEHAHVAHRRREAVLDHVPQVLVQAGVMQVFTQSIGAALS